MKVLRSTLLVAAAVFTAACGDKVTVPPTVTTTITPQVHSVTVAPNTATLTASQPLTLTAAVTADAGAAVTPINWTATGPLSPATGTGTTFAVTASATATGSGAVCASVGGATGCATIVVQAGVGVTPATISIASVTVSCTGLVAVGGVFPPCGLNDPVNPLAVAGQVDVRVNVSAGSGPLTGSTLQLFLTPTAGGTAVLVGTQTFSSSASAALRAASDAAISSSASAVLRAASDATISAQTTPPQVVISVNTAAFNATTGVPTFLNGVYTLSAKLVPASGSATTATSQTSLTLANVNTYALTTSITGGLGHAVNSAAGYAYRNGSIAASVLPVIFTPGITMAAGTLTFGVVGCDATGPRSITLVAPVTGSTAWTAAFTTGPGAAAATNFKAYEYRTGSACGIANIATGEGFTLAGTDNNGNGFVTSAVAANAAANMYRMDNVPPPAPSIVTNPNLRQNGWINPGAVPAANAVSLTGLNAVATPNGWMVNNIVGDAGVGGYIRELRIGAPGAGGIADPVDALTGSATPANPAPTLANNSLCAVPTATDALGNESALPAAGTVCIQPLIGQVTQAAGAPVMLGVDIAPPTIAFSGGMLAGSSGVNGHVAANVGGEFQVSVLDTGSIGVSGMLAGAPVTATVTIRTAAVGLTALQLCPVGTVVAGVCTASSTGFAAPAFPLVATNAVAAKTIIGYYTFTGNSVDAAGNISTAQVTHTVAHNPAGNPPVLTTSLFGTPLTGPTATFTATGSSGNTTLDGPTTFFDLWQVSYNLAYGAGLAGPLLYPSTVINSFNNPAGMMNSNVPVTITVPFVRQIQNQNTACNAPLNVAGTFQPNQLQEKLFDQVNNASAVTNTPILAASVTAGVSYLGAPATNQVYTFIIGNGVVEQPTLGGCPLAAGANSVVAVSGGGTSPDASSITLNGDVWLPTGTNTLGSSFAHVDFYVLVGANLEQIGSATTYAGSDDGSPNGHKYRYSFVWTPGTKSPVSGTAWAAQSSAACVDPTAISLYAIGVSAAGDGLVTPVNQNVCITTAP